MRYFIYTVFFSLFICTTSEAQELKTFKTYEELNHYLSEPKDKPLVVNFWATWCAPCVKELPYFETLHQNNPNIKVITVSLDFEKQVESKLIPFLKKKKYSFITTYLAEKNYNNWIGKVDENWSGSIPATLIIHKEKRIFIEHEFSSYDELNNYINQTINK
jgi:thiol-disulfide isomerase/thioredoxin